MASTYKVHPAIGIARVGDSPEEFFVGPERVGERPDPEGGFKDDRCRVKRQAARFRIFAHHDDGGVTEVTDAEAEITWTAHLVNSKAAYPNRGNEEPAADLVVDPGARTVTRPNDRAELTGGTVRFAGAPRTEVPLGELRTDDAGRLLVLGGHGRSASPVGNGIGNFWANAGWYDDVSDGPVTASIVLRVPAAPLTSARLRGRPLSAARVHAAASHRLLCDGDHRPWLAIGDAALTVDPASGSGVVRALRSAQSGITLATQLLGDPAVAAALLARHESARDAECTAYLIERARHYAIERRFRTPFWARRAPFRNHSVAGS